jgi:hypothetical protein
MTVSIALPDRLAGRLQRQADIQHRSLEDMTLSIIEQSLTDTEADAEFFDLLARARATARPPQYVIQPTGTIDDLDRLLAKDRPISAEEQEEWQREWRKVEAEMEARDVADAIREGPR